MTYRITITFSDRDLTTETVLQAAKFVSETLGDMQMSHVMQCHKDDMRLAEITKELINLKQFSRLETRQR